MKVSFAFQGIVAPVEAIKTQQGLGLGFEENKKERSPVRNRPVRRRGPMRDRPIEDRPRPRTPPRRRPRSPSPHDR